MRRAATRRSACGSAWPTRYVAEMLRRRRLRLAADRRRARAQRPAHACCSRLQAIAAVPGRHAIARVPVGHGDVGTALIKQYLDIGVQTLLVPMVHDAEQAAEVVARCATRRDGMRGMGGAMRGSRAGAGRELRRPEANDEVCLLVQAESREALANLEAIAAVDGVDGVFIGPADLSASMGHLGQPDHPEVLTAIDAGIATVLAAGKAPGIIDTDPAVSARYLTRRRAVRGRRRRGRPADSRRHRSRSPLQALIRDAVRADGEHLRPRFPSARALRRPLTGEQRLSVGAASPYF